MTDELEMRQAPSRRRKGHKTKILRDELHEFGFREPRVVVHSVQNQETEGWVSYVDDAPGVDDHNELTEALESIAKDYGAKYDLWPHYAPQDRVIVWPLPDKPPADTVGIRLQIGWRAWHLGVVDREALAQDSHQELAKFLRAAAAEIERLAQEQEER